MIYIATPQHKRSVPGVLKFTLLVDAWFVWSMPGSREEQYLYTFTQRLPPLLVWVFEIYNLLSYCPTEATYTFGYDWSSFYWEDDFNARRTTHNGRRWTPTYSKRSSEWLWWPKNLEWSSFFLILMLDYHPTCKIHWFELVNNIRGFCFELLLAKVTFTKFN